MARPFHQAVSIMLIDALRTDPALRAVVHVVDDGRRDRLPYPHIRLGEMREQHWGCKDRDGGEVQCQLLLRDKGDLGRMPAISAAVQRVILALPRRFSGWETAGAQLRDRRQTWLSAGVEECRITLRLRGLRL